MAATGAVSLLVAARPSSGGGAGPTSTGGRRAAATPQQQQQQLLLAGGTSLKGSFIELLRGGGGGGGGRRNRRKLRQNALQVQATAVSPKAPEQQQQQQQQQASRAEEFAAAIAGGAATLSDLQAKLSMKNDKLAALQQQIDDLYKSTFAGVTAVEGEDAGRRHGLRPQQTGEADAEQQPTTSSSTMHTFERVDEAMWRELGRSQPAVLQALINTVEQDGKRWTEFQRDMHELTLVRNRVRQEVQSLKAQIVVARQAAEAEKANTAGAEADAEWRLPTGTAAHVVMIAGFESFNLALYTKVAAGVAEKLPGFRVTVFSDRDILSKPDKVEAALQTANAFFASLVFDYDQCEWLIRRVQNIMIRLVFESSLELMKLTQIGSFVMGQSKGMPGPVKAVLSKFGGGKEEDKMVGYLSFLKIGPTLLKFIPGKKVRDLRNWLTVYSYWNQGGYDNVEAMFMYLAKEYLLPVDYTPPAVKETPAVGLYHPSYDGYFTSASDYLRWHRTTHNPSLQSAPVVALLLYRKHVITQQKYIPQLIRTFEADGLLPLPIFINGVESHTIVRDLLTTTYEQDQRRQGIISTPSLKSDAVVVDAIVSTIGFPLVGGPAGSMEGGRQADIAKSILAAKNVPYVVAAPLLIQDINSWKQVGVQGLQSVVLYALPELDGAIDTVPLGGLVGDGIHLVPERARKLTSRLNKWISLRRKPPSQRRVAVVLYGFPPGVGATGTAALLNVPKSLEHVLEALREEGYDVGLKDGDVVDGEMIVRALATLDDDRVIAAGKQGPKMLQQLMVGDGDMPAGGASPVAAEIDAKQLKSWLGRGTLAGRMQRNWGRLESYRGIKTSAEGASVVNGLQLGNVWIGVQPLLGVEGDPMRLLFERDLTPHPQYAAFYKWLENGFGADAVLHFGMHGTVEWLPGSPLGNTGLSWSDALMGSLPNIYVYAANNPSESIVAKRRGYGTIVSHNVPPYGRAGLYKELANLRELVAEYRENTEANVALRPTIVDTLNLTGLHEDCPYVDESGQVQHLSGDTAGDVPSGAFDAYVATLNEYLQLVENRLFSEGLHVLGQPPTAEQTAQYLSAYFDDALPEEAISTISQTPEDMGAIRARLEALLRNDANKENAAKVKEAVQISQLLASNTDELLGIVRALNGEYVPAGVGGDLLRNGPGVLPTGRNIHALDPYRMPSAAAWKRGCAIAENIIEEHRSKNGGAFPETVAVMLWGLDAIKTRGESLAIALHLAGARPVKEGTGRIVRFELVPLDELNRPRIDVLANLSGIFRDSFANVVDLLDDMFQRAAEADEPLDMNYIRKHSLSLKASGVDNAAARIFSNPSGDYGSMVNERIGAGSWESTEELGNTWRSRNAFSYGRGDVEKGVARPEVLRALLKSTDRIVQEIDSVEYGLTDIQEYYANTGAMKNAAETARGGRKVACSIVESFGKEAKPRDLEATLRLEYRSKLLNPKWATAMAAQGSGGAYEISQRMTAMVGWSGTVGFQENWVYDQAASTYALDEEMATKLRKSNPQAFQNIVRRMLEANGRGFWQADEATVERLRGMYEDVQDELEGVK